MHPAVVGHRVTIDTLNAALEGSDAVEDDDPDSPVEAFEQSMLTIKTPTRGSVQGTSRSITNTILFEGVVDLR